MVASRSNFQVELEMSERSSETGSDAQMCGSPNIFGPFRFYQKFSPFNCGAPKPFRFIFIAFTIVAIVSMIFRVYWMFWQVGGEVLKFGWAESKLFGFISFESFVVTIGLLRVTCNDSLNRFEKNLGALQTLRIHRFHKKHDNYRILYIRIFIAGTFMFCSFVLTSVYLVSNKIVTYGAEKQSDWYWIVDPIIAILCAYSNLLFLPTHSLLHHALTREFEVFNDELEEMSKEKKLANVATLRQFGDRQIKLFEFTNFLTARMEQLMVWAPFFALMALLFGTYITTQFDKTPKALYLICLIAISISCFIMSFTLLYPVAFVQEAMSKSAPILMNDPLLQHSDDELVYRSYRMMLDRALHNRTTSNVLHVFSVTRKNIERTFFFHSLAIICMVIVYSFQEGLEEGFGELDKFAATVQHG